MHVRVSDPAEHVAVIREISHPIGKEAYCNSLPRRNGYMNVIIVDCEAMCEIQCPKLDYYLLTLVNGQRRARVDLALLVVLNIRRIEPEAEGCQKYVHSFRLRLSMKLRQEIHRGGEGDGHNQDSKKRSPAVRHIQPTRRDFLRAD